MTVRWSLLHEARKGLSSPRPGHYVAVATGRELTNEEVILLLDGKAGLFRPALALGDGRPMLELSIEGRLRWLKPNELIEGGCDQCGKTRRLMPLWTKGAPKLLCFNCHVDVLKDGLLMPAGLTVTQLLGSAPC